MDDFDVNCHFFSYKKITLFYLTAIIPHKAVYKNLLSKFLSTFKNYLNIVVFFSAIFSYKKYLFKVLKDKIIKTKK